MYTAFLHSIKLSQYRIGIKPDKDPLAIEQSNCLTKIVNLYIVYDSDARQEILLIISNLTIAYLKQLIVKHCDKEKYMYSGFRITFNGEGGWKFDNGSARNNIIFVIIFGIDNYSSSHSDNGKKTFLILCEGPTYGINGNFGSAEKKLIISFTKANTKFCFEFPL